MSKKRCEDCNRWAATNEQWHRWMRWALSERRIDRVNWRWLHNLTQPLWWRLDTTCLGWNDCPGQYYETERRVSPLIRRVFHVRFEPRSTTPEDAE